MTFTQLRRGQLIAVPPPDQAVEFLERDARLTPSGEIPGRRGIVGSPEKVRAGLEELASAYQADEVIVVTITYDHGMRRRSYELLAEAMSLEPRALSASSA
jgi:alkanesulfonate monooxygenase SsuD/methylene tetrahydromethanopterin reductase-like flavin-dependent oxidoreductase (luciferase family)